MKKGFTLPELIGVIIILSLICLIAFPPILSAIRGSKNELSEASKKIIYDATDLYITDNVDKYPKNNGNIYCVSLESLVKGEYLPQKVYDSSTATEVSLDSLVEVKVEQGNYSYNLNNNCKNLFQYGSLIDVLLQQYNPNNTKGLVKDSENENVYYYTGNNVDVSNNHLWYGGHHWRIIEFNTKERTVTLISQQPLTVIQPANTVWTSKELYEESYVNTWLNEYFYNTIDKNIQKNIKDNVFNVGIYNNVSEITTIQKIGMLDNNQYVRAGSQNSYLDIKTSWWLGNRFNNTYIRSINVSGVLGNNTLTMSYGIRPVIKINDIDVVAGAGTLTSNYKTSLKSDNTNDVQVGEYINVPTNSNYCGTDKLCTFRVIEKNNDSIKVTLNGLLPQTSQYGPSSILSVNYTVYTILNNFKNSISDNYIYLNNKIFYIGKYEDVSGIGQDYKNVTEETLLFNVGLPVIGELLSSNDIDLSTLNSKIFVDVDTIENPTIEFEYWSMNASSSSYVRTINYSGYLGSKSSTSSYGVRPIIYLKNNLNFIGGDGTAQSPYVLQ